MRIFFTGGSGKAGRHVVPYLLAQGHRVVNVDLKPLDHPKVDYLAADTSDSGQMFYNVVEAAVKIGIRKISVASSETTYGICFADGEASPPALPVDETCDTNPMDSYGLSKLLNEKTARVFHPAVRRRNLFNYFDARDLGQIVDLCLKKDGLGFQVFNAANDENSAKLPAAELAKTYFPGVPLAAKHGIYEGLYSNRKAREVLGFREQHSWRRYVKT